MGDDNYTYITIYIAIGATSYRALDSSTDENRLNELVLIK